MRNRLLSTLEGAWQAASLFAFFGALTTAFTLWSTGAFNPAIAANCFVFCMWWFRWYPGNMNYLLNTYDSRSHSSSLKIGHRVIFDLILLMSHTAAFTFMALNLSDCRKFTDGVILLNLTDCWWLFYEQRCWPVRMQVFWKALGEQQWPPRVSLKPYPPRTWTWNNLACAIALYACQRWIGPESYASMTVAVCVASFLNGLVDVKETSLMFKSK